jgi:hypothetical protein
LAIESVRRVNASRVDVVVRSQDGTADNVHVLANVAADLDEAGVLALVKQGRGRAERIDRALFRVQLELVAAAAPLTVVGFEPSGTRNVQPLELKVP